MTGRWVECEFDCLPLRSVSRLDVPVDASPKFERFVLRVRAAVEKHGAHNSFYLHRGRCVFHLTNDEDFGRIQYRFEGTALTDASDQKTRSVDLTIELDQETCGWLNQPAVEFLLETVRRAVLVEFDRYIAAGDLERARERAETIEKQSDAEGGFIGMYL